MLRLVIFLCVYFVIYGGLHLYFYCRLRRGFDFSRPQRNAVKGFLVVMVLGPLLTRAMEGTGWHGVAQMWAVLVFLWMGLLFLSVSLFFFADIARYITTLLRHLPGLCIPQEFFSWRRLVIGVLSLSSVAACYGYFAAREIRIDTVTIVTDKLPATVERYRMVQLTDIHLGVMTDAEWLQRIVGQVNALQPDLIVATGDIIDSRIPSALPYLETLGRLQARDGKYAVAGNHEFFAGIDNSVAYMEKGGFRMLRGEKAEVRPWLHLMGVDDREARLTDGVVVDHEQQLMEGADASAFTILLKHQPVVRDASIGKFDLQLAGHVHSGQIFPFRLVTWLAYPVAMGLSDMGEGSQLYVSRGTGTWGPPIRVMAPPEITVFEFVAKEKPAGE